MKGKEGSPIMFANHEHASMSYKTVIQELCTTIPTEGIKGKLCLIWDTLHGADIQYTGTATALRIISVPHKFYALYQNSQL